jgi:hypothetical protein
MINEGDKIRLQSGKIGLVSEVLGNGAAFIIEAFGEDDHVHIYTITRDDVYSVFEEVEHPLGAVS